MKEYKNISSLLADLFEYQGIHIECSHEAGEQIRNQFYLQYKDRPVSYITHTDKGYERQTVKEYLKFFEKLTESKKSYKTALREFELEEIKSKKLRYCTSGEQMRLNFARISLQHTPICFLENPLSDVDTKTQKTILEWIEAKSQEGVRFVTTTLSLRHALLLPGNVFYADGARYLEVEQDTDSSAPDVADVMIYKIAAKSGTKTLLFEPKDIDYIESMNKSVFVFVRGNHYPVGFTMDELEKSLVKYGFFRCHRSYIVNIQKVSAIEKWTKNSFSLLLNTESHSQVPLAKGRAAQLKELFH